MLPEVVFVSPSLDGGAGRACARLADGLLKVAANELTIDLQTAIGPQRFRVGFLRDGAIRLLNFLGKRAIPAGQAFTIALVSTGLGASLNNRPKRVVHIHSLSSRLLSLREIRKLRGPILWTLHDTWPTNGLFHFLVPEGSLPSKKRPTMLARPVAKFLTTIIRHELVEAIHPEVVFVAPSKWAREQLLQSQFGSRNRVVLIPNPLDTEFWQATDRTRARHFLGLDGRKIYLLFASSGHPKDPRKGAHHLREVLRIISVASECSDGSIELLVAGSRPDALKKCPFPINYLGPLDDSEMRAAYSAADIVIVPSEIDNLPQVATEAQSCGRPVVAFNVGGLADIVVDGSTGFLVDAFNHEAMAHAILRLVREIDLDELSVRAAERARALWGLEKIGAEFKALYLEMSRVF